MGSGDETKGYCSPSVLVRFYFHVGVGCGVELGCDTSSTQTPPSITITDNLLAFFLGGSYFCSYGVYIYT